MMVVTLDGGPGDGEKVDVDAVLGRPALAGERVRLSKAWHGTWHRYEVLVDGSTVYLGMVSIADVGGQS